MAQKKILLDACSYLRLANNHHPLLGIDFGPDNYCLYVLPEFDDEYNRSHRLKNKFHWVSQPEYKANRSGKLFLQKRKKEIAIRFIADFASRKGLGVSLPDIKTLATANILEIPVVTDDSDMREVAREHNIELFNSLEILKLMLDSDAINMRDVRRTVKYWRYNDDLPANFNEDYKNLFKKTPPK